MLEKAKKEERIAIYSGDMISEADARRSNSKYIVKVTKYYLDAEHPKHARWAGMQIVHHMTKLTPGCEPAPNRHGMPTRNDGGYQSEQKGPSKQGKR